MNTIKIDEEFKKLIPPLTKEEYKGLEKDILANGCRVPLDIWNGIVIDGHNRYDICKKHNIKYLINNISFDSRTDVLIWIINNQLNRRNISSYDRVILIQRQESLIQSIKDKAKEKQVEGGKDKVRQKSSQPPIKTRDELSKLAGVSHDTYRKAVIVSQEAKPEQIEEMREKKKSINAVYNEIQKAKPKPESPPLPEGKYNIIYADPPWRYNDKRGNCSDYAGITYPTMTIEEIAVMPIKNISADNCILFIWVTMPMLDVCFEVITRWGFKYKTCGFVWVKTRPNTMIAVSHGIGNYTKSNVELCLIATKGQFKRNQKNVEQIVYAPRGRHSEKPAIIRERIIELCGDVKRVELFARKKVEGWASYGNEIL